ncbi:MAG: helix-turn-helix domain-containing protein [Bacteroidales bacterium]|nr:helix-turn-helix domain-containing protein [Bacteroidales bacterium]
MSDKKNMEAFGIEFVRDSGVATYVDENIFLLDNFKDFSDGDLPVRLDMPIWAVCLKGEMSCIVDNLPYTLHEGDAAFCLPYSYVSKRRYSPDFKGKILGLSSGAIRRNVLWTGKDLFGIIEYRKDHSVILLDKPETNIFCCYYDLIKAKSAQEIDLFQKEGMDALFQVLLCELCSIMTRRISPSVPAARSVKREDWIFNNFLRLLTEGKGRERSVTAYANQLHVTPKYLSTVVKSVSKRTALEWIHECTAEIVAHELKYTDKTIKEIAFALKFPSLSFFGKFCKAHLGLSPKEYRQQMGRPGV